MGKIRTKLIGDEAVEKADKVKQKTKRAEKKLAQQVQEADSDQKVSVDEKVEPKAKQKSKKTTTRPKKTHGKKYLLAQGKVDSKKLYSLADAVKILKKIKYASFDESVELHINADEKGLKGEVEFPHSTGKTVVVKVADEAIISELEQNKISFDVLVAHPSFMPKLLKFAKVLGPKGLMPNPKSGTVSPNPSEVVERFAKGSVRWKSEPKFPLIHQMVGKISFDDNQLSDNVKAFLNSVGTAHIEAVYIKTTMSPSLHLDPLSLS